MQPALRLTTRACLLLLAAMPVSAQQIYKWTDASGQVHYSDQPPPTAARANAEVVGQLQKIDAAQNTKSPAAPVEEVPSQYQQMTPERRELLEKESRDHEQRLADDARQKQEERDRQKAEAQKVSDREMMANCWAHREWYCNKPLEEVRRLENEKAWREYEAAMAATCSRHTRVVPCLNTQPVPPEGPPPRIISDAQRIYEKNAGKHPPPRCPGNVPVRKGIDNCKF